MYGRLAGNRSLYHRAAKHCLDDVAHSVLVEDCHNSVKREAYPGKGGM